MTINQAFIGQLSRPFYKQFVRVRDGQLIGLDINHREIMKARYNQIRDLVTTPEEYRTFIEVQTECLNEATF